MIQPAMGPLRRAEIEQMAANWPTAEPIRVLSGHSGAMQGARSEMRPPEAVVDAKEK